MLGIASTDDSNCVNLRSMYAAHNISGLPDPGSDDNISGLPDPGSDDNISGLPDPGSDDNICGLPDPGSDDNISGLPDPGSDGGYMHNEHILTHMQTYTAHTYPSESPDPASDLSYIITNIHNTRTHIYKYHLQSTQGRFRSQLHA